MPNVTFDTYYRYDDLTNILRGYAEEYPQLVRLESIGKSYEGRDIWLVTVTNFSTGEDRHKPALWVDANIHATEISPSSACLYLINRLLTAYGDDADIRTFLLNHLVQLVHGLYDQRPDLFIDHARIDIEDAANFESLLSKIAVQQQRRSQVPGPYDHDAMNDVRAEFFDQGLLEQVGAVSPLRHTREIQVG